MRARTRVCAAPFARPRACEHGPHRSPPRPRTPHPAPTPRLAGYPPFQGESATVIYQRIVAGHIDFPAHFEADARDLVRRLLCEDRARRLGGGPGGAADVKAHAWFAGRGPAAARDGGAAYWERVLGSGAAPPFVPRVRGAADTSNFDAYPNSDDEDSGRAQTPENAGLFAEIDAL